METLNRLLDWLYLSLVAPFFLLLGKLLSLLLLKPLDLLQTPIWLQVFLLAVLTACFAFWLRGILDVDGKLKRFNTMFAGKRQEQQDFHLTDDKHTRKALYQSTDDDLNAVYNTYLAGHYARYVLIYLLPIFLILAWLNTVYPETFLTRKFGIPYVLPAPENGFGVQGLSVTLVFLLTYIVTLIIGFRIRRYRSQG